MGEAYHREVVVVVGRRRDSRRAVTRRQPHQQQPLPLLRLLLGCESRYV